MKKKSAKKPARSKTSKTKREPVARINTHGSNGAPSTSAAPPEPEEKVTIGEAMRLAVEELGEVVVDDKLAPQQMLQLAECYEDVTKAQAAFNAKAEAAKTAKKSLESATNLLLEKVRAFTHPAPMPLFDQAQADGDLDTMLGAMNGGASGGSDTAFA